MKEEYKISDLTKDEYELLKLSYFHTYNNPDEKVWVCFGNSYYKLCALDLIDKDLGITYTGRELVKYLLRNM